MKINNVSIPDNFVCPITQNIMDDPVTVADGITYERRAIIKWLSSKDYSPIGIKLKNKDVIPNLALKHSITTFAMEESLLDNEQFTQMIEEDELELNIRELQLKIDTRKLAKDKESMEKVKQKQKRKNGHLTIPDRTVLNNKRTDLVHIEDDDDPHEARPIMGNDSDSERKTKKTKNDQGEPKPQEENNFALKLLIEVLDNQAKQ